MKAVLYTDGGSRGNPGPAGLGCILFDAEGNLLDFDAKYLGSSTNNQAEYSALILGIKLAQKNQVKVLICHLDSELVVKQLNGEYRIKDENMQKLKHKIDALIESFESINYIHVPRAQNKYADKLVNLVLDAHNEES